MYPAVINDEQCVKQFIDLNGEDNCITVEKQMIAEDFSYYLKEVPGAFIFLGTKNEAKGFIHPLHSSQFNFNETVLLKGVQGYINLIEN
jgi:metal-dependent amidase/aminoacylase/carboxypeptidase family protein